MIRLKSMLLCASLTAMMATTGNTADIIWVHQMRGNGGEDTGATPGEGQGLLEWEDDQWRVLIEGAGHSIVEHEPFSELLFDDDSVATLNSADLVIFSRDIASGDYDDIISQEGWSEGVTAPMLVLSPYVLRNGKWDWAASDAIIEQTKDVGLGPLQALVPDHPIFEGVLDANGEAVVWDIDALGPGDNIDFLNIQVEDGKIGNGTVLAIEPSMDVPWIVYWEEGVEYYDDSLYVAAGPRLHYSVGSDDDPFTWGEKNITPAGDQILLNAINWLTGGESSSGDFNGNGSLDIDDINSLTTESAAGTNNGTFDISGDGLVDAADVTQWIKVLKNSWVGDANLDGEFSSSDLVSVFQKGLFETAQPANWEGGDWNGDGVFSSSDFVVAFQDGGFEQGPRAGVQAVPEPNSVSLLLPMFIGLLMLRRRA